MASKRFLIVPEDSSAARMPLPGATMASATLFNSSRFIAFSLSIVVPARAESVNPESRIPRIQNTCTWLRVPGSRTALAPRDGRSISRLFYSQHLNSRQGLAFEPFQKCTAGGRDISQSIDYSRDLQRGYRIAAARYRNKLASFGQFRGGFRDFDSAVVEWFHFESAEWAIPHQRFGARQHGNNLFNAARPNVQNHFGGTDFIAIDDARKRVGRQFIGHDNIDREHDFTLCGVGLGHDLVRGGSEVSFC